MSERPEPAARPAPLSARVLRLCLWIAGLWFFFAVISPRLTALSPAWQRFNAAQEEKGLHSGAVYYTDVPVTREAESHVREAVRRGMAERKARRERR